MKLYDAAVNMIDTLIPYFKEEGASDKTISGGLDFAYKILSKFPMKQTEREAVLKAIEEAKKGLKK